ncbi:hypothetical protein SSX86_015863 [Deinandra increscens subsp. villosa]|uniref:NB-ARC domain-containing protein n=1 Tax=Deinandra increscens subsp. villosa TaxID=3103831 RepID=A0AAP0CWU5_9ASTR
MDVLSAIITPIIESVIVPIKKHMGFFVSSTNYVEDMKTKMNQLSLTQHDIQERKRTADVKNHVVSHHVSHWLEDVNKVKDTVDSISGGIGCFSVAKRYKAGKQSYYNLIKINDLEEQGSNIPWTNEQKSLARISSRPAPVSSGTIDNSVASGTQNNFESRDFIFKNALKALQPNSYQKMIALCGMGGVGKTTMMEQLKKDAEDSKMFRWIVKVVLGENIDPISLQDAIAQSISVDLTETTRDARAARLFKCFEGMSKQGKNNILVIMDDVWKTFDLKDVGLCPLPKGAKILFTSRLKSVCTQMGVTTDSIFNVCVLNDEEAKTLFFGSVELSDGDDPDLQNIGEDIVKICGGLPIAIVTIAKVLRGNIKYAWQETLSKLREHDLQGLGIITDTIFKMSYDNLETKDDKAVFLLSGLFPEDFNISIEDLMMYGWGLKLFTKVYTLAEARRRANVCVNNLLRANLLTESQSMGCVKIHDLTRSFVLSNFSKVKQASIVMHDNKSRMQRIEDAHDTYERILLRCKGMSEFPIDFTNNDNLSLLILMDENHSLHLPKDLHKRMENLEVVSYEGMHIPMLPTTFVHSPKLRTLCFHSCNLIQDHIYVIGSLSNLETLSFAYCGLSMLPSTIGELKKLKLLDLTGCVNLCIEDGVFQNLGSLEELYMRASPGKPIRFTNANYEEFKILLRSLCALELEFFEKNSRSRYVSLKNLKRFRISIGCELEKNEKTSFRNTLDIVADNNELQECNIRDLFEETEELKLQVNDMIHLQDVSMDHTFSQLKVLHVFKCADLTYLFTFEVASGLKKLERLKISECPVLITLVGEICGVIRFPKLKFMDLEDLPNMVSLCEDNIEFPEMVELRVDGLSSITSIYSDNNMCAMQSLLSKEVVIPMLEKLFISQMENLKQIWPCQISTVEKNNVSMLKEINIKECDNLVNLFPSNPLPLLNHLEEIEVGSCALVEVLFNIDLERVHEMEGYSSRLRRIDVYELENLQELWRMKGVNNSDILINEFISVERIILQCCRRFTNLFTPTTINFDLGALIHYDTDVIGDEIDDVIEIKEVDTLTYPSYLLHTSHRLQHLQLYGDTRVGEVVFDMDSPSSRQLPTVQPSVLQLPYLQYLKLAYLHKMSHVWKCSNWNAFLIPEHQPQLQLPFQNLTEIHLIGCGKIKYLFSPLMAKYLVNLKEVEIGWCGGITEVISSIDEENTTSTSSHQNMTTFFPHLETLELRSLPCLKSVDDGGDTRSRRDKISSDITNTIHDQFQSAQVIGASWSFCQYPRKIIIRQCDALASLIPWYALREMKRLQELHIKDCKTMMQILESETSTNSVVDEESAHGGANICTTLTIKNITNVVITQLTNLKIVSISGCNLLPHIFTFSTLGSLKQLNKLLVKGCEAIQVILKEEDGTSSKGVQVFPRLQTLELDDLPNLRGFFLGVNEFEWPTLNDVMINDCPQMMVFTSSQSKTPRLKYIRSSIGKHSLESCGLNVQTTFPNSSDVAISKHMSWSFHNLIEINREWTSDTTIIPSRALEQLQQLENIHLKGCSKVEEIFEVGLEGRNNNSGFDESPIVIAIPNLTQVNLIRMSGLKYLWKSTSWMVPEFPSLTTLNIDVCPKLEHVFTCSMVDSLLQLHHLSIINCKNIEVIVKEEDKKECDVKVNENIMLSHLKSLKLEHLPRLQGFCIANNAFSLPTLDTLEIKGCPAITVFTKRYPATPNLKVIDTSFGEYNVMSDLNSFIQTKQEEGYKF